MSDKVVSLEERRAVRDAEWKVRIENLLELFDRQRNAGRRYSQGQEVRIALPQEFAFIRQLDEPTPPVRQPFLCFRMDYSVVDTFRSMLARYWCEVGRAPGAALFGVVTWHQFMIAMEDHYGSRILEREFSETWFVCDPTWREGFRLLPKTDDVHARVDFQRYVWEPRGEFR